MIAPSNPEADAKVAEALETLHEIQKVLANMPDRDLPFVTPVSHVEDYQNDPARLKAYGSQVIGNRSVHFAMLNAIKAYWNIQMYLDGLATGSVFALPAAARGQIELFAMVWHVYDVVATNAGFEKPDLANRMRTIDEAFIMAIHGTRGGELTDLYHTKDLSKLRPTNPRDIENFKAKNILTRIQKAEGRSQYTTCLADYERLSDFLHPNSPQNLILMTLSERGQGWFHLALKHPQHLRRAQYQSAHAMVNASFEILRLVTDVPDPFGPPIVGPPNAIANPATPKSESSDIRVTVDGGEFYSFGRAMKRTNSPSRLGEVVMSVRDGMLKIETWRGGCELPCNPSPPVTAWLHGGNFLQLVRLSADAKASGPLVIVFRPEFGEVALPHIGTNAKFDKPA